MGGPKADAEHTYHKALAASHGLALKEPRNPRPTVAWQEGEPPDGVDMVLAWSAGRMDVIHRDGGMWSPTAASNDCEWCAQWRWSLLPEWPTS